MKLYRIGFYILRILGVYGLAMLAPLVVSFIFEENTHVYFYIPVAFCLLSGLASLLYKGDPPDLRYHDTFLLVTLTWVIVSITGALPYYISHYFTSFADAYFESVSGFTATGSTILNDIESLPKSILFWRSETHWLGGMGIIVMVIALFPNTPGKKFLFESEAPIAPDERKFFPRFSEIAKKFWKVYLLLTVIQVVMLLPAMNLYEAITHSFSSIAGGGFSTRNDSVAAFNSEYIEIVLSIFMIAGATSFVLHYRALRGKPGIYFKSTSFKTFLGIIFITSILSTIILINKTDYTLLGALRDSFFTIISLITTTGFATADFKYWPESAQFILILVMFFGGMSLSTSGSIKMSRWLVFWGAIKSRITKMLHPKSVQIVTLDGTTLPNENIIKALNYIYAYVIIFIISGVLIKAVEGYSTATAFTSIAATLGNVGPGIGDVGPFNNFEHFTIFSKYFFTVIMLIGRLEIWTIIALLTSEIW